jgi:hypothetical protein
MSVPTSESAAKQVSRKRLLQSSDNETIESKASTTNDHQEKESLDGEKRNKIQAAESTSMMIECPRSTNNETLQTDVNSNLQVVEVESKSVSEAVAGTSSATSFLTSGTAASELCGVLKCPAHYDAEVWDALPRELQWEILHEAAPVAASPASARTGISTGSTPATKGSSHARKVSKATGSKQKAAKEKNSILKYLSKP